MKTTYTYVIEPDSRRAVVVLRTEVYYGLILKVTEDHQPYDYTLGGHLDAKLNYFIKLLDEQINSPGAFCFRSWFE